MSTDSEQTSWPVSRIYLDNNATTHPLPEVIESVAHHLHHSYANPGSRHADGQIARKALEESREKIAAILGADADEVILTSGGTEATNMAIFGCLPSNPGVIVLTAGEHPATLESCRVLEQRGFELLFLDVDRDGRLIAEQYGQLPWGRIRLVTVILAHNETGVVQELEPLATLCNDNRVPFHIDAVQAVGKIPVDFQALGATTLALGAHKFHGPRGIGALLLRTDTNLVTTQFGGHQESGRRPGTEMVALAVGMSRALELWNANESTRTEHVRLLRDRLQAGLTQHCDPVVVNGSMEHRLPNTLNIAFPGADGEALLVALDLEGISCSLGSTCASGSADPAPVLVAMGCSAEIYQSSVRFSIGMENTSEEIDDAISRIARVVAKLRRPVNAAT